jgi:hypothetical protein
MITSISSLGSLVPVVVLSIALCAPAVASNGDPTTPLFGSHPPTYPKVPFGNKPCESLNAEELRSIGASTNTPTKPDRAPANLPFDNVCTYSGFSVGYMTEIDYTSNMHGNRSTSRTAPTNLPGAFYDRQGGLWFTKNGYYVTLEHSHELSEKAAHIIVGKL